VPAEGQVQEHMQTRKREVEARIKAEKQAKREQRAAGKKEYHRGVDEDEEGAFEDEDSLAVMRDIRVHDSRIKNFGFSTLLFTDKHPLALEEEFDTIAEEWPTFQFEKKKNFKYDIFVIIDRPAVSEGDADEEE